MKKADFAESGIISTGTLRAIDLVPAFSDALEYLTRPTGKGKRKAKYQRLIDDAFAMEIDNENDCYISEEFATEMLEYLADALSEFAPPYGYFGSHVGDGADYGFWLTEFFDDEFDGLRVGDLADVPKKHSGEVLVVNDHGNMTLYLFRSGHKRKLWSLV